MGYHRESPLHGILIRNSIKKKLKIKKCPPARPSFSKTSDAKLIIFFCAALRIIPVVSGRIPGIALFKCSVLQLCNNYCSLIVLSSPIHAMKRSSSRLTFEISAQKWTLFGANRGVIPYSQHHPAVSEGVIWETFHSQESPVLQTATH